MERLLESRFQVGTLFSVVSFPVAKKPSMKQKAIWQRSREDRGEDDVFSLA